MQSLSLIMRTFMVIALSVSVLYLQGCCKDKKQKAKPPAQGANFTTPTNNTPGNTTPAAEQPAEEQPPETVVEPEGEQDEPAIINDLGDGPEVNQEGEGEVPEGENTEIPLNQIEGDGPE